MRATADTLSEMLFTVVFLAALAAYAVGAPAIVVIAPCAVLLAIVVAGLALAER